jgi:hypothetical protein
MSSVVISGDTSGAITLSAPAVAGTNTITLPASTGTVMVNGPAFSAYASTNQTVTSGAFTKVTFGTEAFDTNNNFASSRFTPTVAGYYQVNASIALLTSITTVIPAIYKNSGQHKVGTRTSASLNAGVSTLVYCNGTTDYIEAYVYISIGQDLNGDPDGSQTWFNASMIRGA